VKGEIEKKSCKNKRFINRKYAIKFFNLVYLIFLNHALTNSEMFWYIFLTDIFFYIFYQYCFIFCIFSFIFFCFFFICLYEAPKWITTAGHERFWCRVEWENYGDGFVFFVYKKLCIGWIGALFLVPPGWWRLPISCLCSSLFIVEQRLELT
jgi:ABC-type phosphate transport system permease subunit